MSGDGDDRALRDPAPCETLRRSTPARVALGRAGVSLPTAEVLRLAHAHALARDAVHTDLDRVALRDSARMLGLTTVEVSSAVADRATYLRRPDLGRVLAAGDRAGLVAGSGPGADLAIVIADGLSAAAIHANAMPLLTAMLPGIAAAGWRLAPIVLATQARVALGDDIGAALDARLMLMLIGERPGLSAADSLGAYLTYAPQPGRRDNERNCVSNIRAAGLSPERAAGSILWLIAAAMARGQTGVGLKDESGNTAALPSSATPGSQHPESKDR